MTTSCPAHVFLHDVRDHELTIVLDQGLHRHITLGRPGSGAYRFHITTWPGYLAISGDCGSYTFARLRDMFQFFRDDSGQNRINEGYWSEKLQAVDRHGGRDELDEEAYNDAIRAGLLRHIQDENLALSQAKDVVREAKCESLIEPPDDHSAAIDQAMRFRCPVTDRYPFEDFYENHLTRCSYRLVWCMRAIVWGIKQYDQAKFGTTQADHDRRIVAGAL
jgi:hypothetical protein